MSKQKEILTIINGIKFYKGNIINNGNKKELIIYTDLENYRISTDEDILKACNRIYKLWYD